MGEFRMPSLGAGMEAGTVARWKRAPGDAVKRGDIVAEIETEKGLIEVEVFEDGVVESIVVPEGIAVEVGTVLAVIGTGVSSAEPRAAAAPDSPSPSAPASARDEVHATPGARALAREGGIPLVRVEPSGRHGTVTRGDVSRALDARAAMPATTMPSRAMPPERARFSPRARALAATLGVELAAVRASAADGVVRAIDVESAARRGPASAVEDPRAAMRRAIATAMTRAKREIPHYYVSHTIDVTPTLERLAVLNQSRPVSARILPAAAILRATVRALADVPELNAWWTGQGAPPRREINLGVAIALRGGGLVAPAILDAGRMSLDELMAALNDLVARARSGTLRARELADASITVTSLGDRGVETVFPIVHPPQVAMVGFGKIALRPWVVGDEVRPRSLVTASLAADHRVSDGHRGGIFLARIESYLSSPTEEP